MNRVFFKDLVVLGKFLDVLLGINTVKLLGMEEMKFMSWKNEYKRGLNVVLESEKEQTIFFTLQRGIFFFSQIAVFWLGAYWVFNDELTLGQYLAAIAIFMIVLNALNSVAFLWIQINDLSISFARINDVLVQETEPHDILESKKLGPIENISVRNLSFKYPGANNALVLKDISLEIKKGQKIGLVGRNGTGKSTLVKLIVNLYSEYAGDIVINEGINVLDVNLHDLRKRVFMFPQDIYIFNGTIRENIICANPNASNEEVVRAVELAELHDFVKSLHFGYNQKIGDEGANLSGGQILKIGFARLFLCNPDIIILDEASSQLDVQTERNILRNIKSKFKEKTIISIAHRINTLKKSDVIYVLDNGMISESGSHKKLMKKKGLYFDFIKTYVSY